MFVFFPWTMFEKFVVHGLQSIDHYEYFYWLNHEHHPWLDHKLMLFSLFQTYNL